VNPEKMMNDAERRIAGILPPGKSAATTTLPASSIRRKRLCDELSCSTLQIRDERFEHGFV